jgi:hypothetical protein
MATCIDHRVHLDPGGVGVDVGYPIGDQVHCQAGRFVNGDGGARRVQRDRQVELVHQGSPVVEEGPGVGDPARQPEHTVGGGEPALVVVHSLPVHGSGRRVARLVTGPAHRWTRRSPRP